MQHLKKLTSQHLVLAACAALAVAGTLLSHGSALSYLPLALAVACGLGAFARSRDR